MNSDTDEINADNCRIDNGKTEISQYFKYKTITVGSKPDDNNTLDKKAVVPLKYLSSLQKNIVFEVTTQLIYYLLFYSKIVTMILRQILWKSITCR